MQKLSEFSLKKNKFYSQHTKVKEHLKLFLIYLNFKGVNISEFTRKLWKNSPEYQEFTEEIEKKPETLSWLRKELPEGKK